MSEVASPPPVVATLPVNPNAKRPDMMQFYSAIAGRTPTIGGPPPPPAAWSREWMIQHVRSWGRREWVLQQIQKAMASAQRSMRQTVTRMNRAH